MASILLFSFQKCCVVGRSAVPVSPLFRARHPLHRVRHLDHRRAARPWRRAPRSAPAPSARSASARCREKIATSAPGASAAARCRSPCRRRSQTTRPRNHRPRHLVQRLALRHARPRRRRPRCAWRARARCRCHEAQTTSMSLPPSTAVSIRQFSSGRSLAGLRGRVQQHAVGLARSAREAVAVEPVIRQALSGIAQRLGRQGAVARDRATAVPFDRMLDVVERRRQRLLDALAVVAAPCPAPSARSAPT